MSTDNTCPCGEYCAVVDECNARGREIERLRAEVERLTRERDDLDARLTELFASSVSYIRKKHDAVARAEAAERKVAVLRAELTFYSERMTYVARSGMECGITRDHFGDRARAALKETEQ